MLVVCKPPHESTAGVDERGHHIHHLSRILFCTDLSENSERALKYAISLTSEYDAELTLLAYIGEGPTAGQGGRDHSCSDGATGKTDSGGRAQDRKNCDGSADRKAYEQIIQFAQESQIDLAIMGVRGRGGVDLAIFGSTTYRVMQLGPARSSLATFRHLSGYTTHVSFGQKSRSSGPLACNPWYRFSEWTVLRSVQCAPTAIQGSYGGQGSDMTI